MFRVYAWSLIVALSSWDGNLGGCHGKRSFPTSDLNMRGVGGDGEGIPPPIPFLYCLLWRHFLFLGVSLYFRLLFRVCLNQRDQYLLFKKTGLLQKLIPGGRAKPKSIKFRNPTLRIIAWAPPARTRLLRSKWVRFLNNHAKRDKITLWFRFA